MICCSFSLNYSHYLFPPSIEQNELHDVALSFGVERGRSCHGDWPASSLVITDCGEMRGVKVEREALAPLSTETWPLISDRHYNKH